MIRSDSKQSDRLLPVQNSAEKQWDILSACIKRSCTQRMREMGFETGYLKDHEFYNPFRNVR